MVRSSNSNVPMKSSYLKYLPALYRDDEFMGQFLLIFESIMRPFENTVDNLDFYFNPYMTPESLLPWLSSWLGLVLDPTWPLYRRRELVKSSAELYRWRGTRRGLSEYLRIYTGSVPGITEYIPGVSEDIPGMSLNQETKLGINTRLGSSATIPHFNVTLSLKADNTINDDTVRAIIESQKPVHAGFTLQIERKS